MTFTLTHTMQSALAEPIAIQVSPEPRGEYQSDCKCKFVFVVAPDSIDALISRGLVLESQRLKRTAVCACMGTLGAPPPHIPALSRPIAFIDIESTGTNTETDRIIEFAAVVLNPDGSRRKFCQRFNPEMPIPAEATAIHGIIDADVAQYPTFISFAPKLSAALKGKDLGGYNLRAYDLIILDAELRRAGLKLDMTGVRVIDTFGIYRKKHPRKLENAIREYCGRSHEDAHGALPDAEGSLDVWLGQMAAHADIREMTLEQQDDYGLHEGQGRPADLAGKLHYDAGGKLCYSFGKNKGQRIEDEPGFCQWMLRQNSPAFPGSTCEVLRAELDRLGL